MPVDRESVYQALEELKRAAAAYFAARGHAYEALRERQLCEAAIAFTQTVELTKRGKESVLKTWLQGEPFYKSKGGGS